MSDVIITADKTPWYQWDTGLAVTVSGGDMTECHFANRKQGTAYVQAVIKGKAKVPDELLQVAAPIKAYGYISDGGGGQTYVEQSFDVIARNIPSDYTYTKTAQKTIRDAETARDQAYAAANDILEVGNEVVGFRNEAKASADAAKKSAGSAEYQAGRAKTNADDAGVAMANAQSFAKMSSVHATESEGSAKKSAQSASAAATSASEASVSASEAATAKAGAETARDAAATSAANAAQSASQAAASVDAINVIAPKTVTTAAAQTGTGVAIGNAAVSNFDGSVALGSGSVTSNKYQISLGNNTLTREITHVSTPTTPSSAANKHYVDTTTSNALVGYVSGKLLHVEDAWPDKPLSLNINGAYKQDGTPSPENPVPIEVIENPVIKVTGRNILNLDAGVNKNFIKNNNGTYTLIKNTNSDRFSGEIPFDIQNEQSVYMSGSRNEFIGKVSVLVKFNDGSQITIPYSNRNFTNIIDENAPLHFIFYVEGVIENGASFTFSPQLEYGTNANAYAPYTSATLQITLPAEHPYLAALPNGIHDEIIINNNDGNALLIARTQKVDVSNLPAPSAVTPLNNGMSRYQYWSVIPTHAMDDTAATAPAFSSVVDYAFPRQGIYVSNVSILVGATADPTEALKTGKYIYTSLATPVTYSLGKLDIPSLPETISNVWTDAELTTDMSMAYKQDVNAVIAGLKSAIAELTSKTANDEASTDDPTIESDPDYSTGEPTIE